MTYSKEVTNKIVECWGLGFTAEETVKTMEQWKGIRVGLATVYRHRHNLTAQNLIDELIRRQERAILKADADDPALAMKYRDKLLEKLIPQRIETKGELTQTQQVLHLHMWKPETVDPITSKQ